jgi:NAD(P)-dependent dehydrogenase (short-subunit alcohol dehydrogenase family)
MRFLQPLNPPLTDWRGKTVWIVGASTGIGLATAEALHALGEVTLAFTKRTP